MLSMRSANVAYGWMVYIVKLAEWQFIDNLIEVEKWVENGNRAVIQNSARSRGKVWENG